MVRKGDRYFLHVTYTLNSCDDFEEAPITKNIISLDPGLVHAQVSYDFNNQRLIEYTNSEDAEAYLRLLTRKEKQLAKKPSKSKRRTAQRIELKIQNWKTELHNKIINDLVKSCDVVVCPKFEVQGMNLKGTGRKKNRLLRLYSHFTLRTKLQRKFEQYKHKTFILGKEPYTSRTCGVCYHVNDKLHKRSEVMTCKKCKTGVLRDGSGARNNGLVFLSVLDQIPFGGTGELPSPQFT